MPYSSRIFFHLVLVIDQTLEPKRPVQDVTSSLYWGRFSYIVEQCRCDCLRPCRVVELFVGWELVTASIDAVLKRLHHMCGSDRVREPRVLGAGEDERCEAELPDAPKTLPVDIAVQVRGQDGRTDRGAIFHAARAVAEIRLHRARFETVSRPGVAYSPDVATSSALEDLVERVFLALTW